MQTQNIVAGVKALSVAISRSEGIFPDAMEQNDPEFFIRKAFEEDPDRGCALLFRAYYRDLCSVAVRIVYSRQSAEDIVGEVFLTFWDQQIYRAIRLSFRAYLFRAVRNRAFNYLKHELSRHTDSLEFLEDETQVNEIDRPDHILQMDELIQQIDRTIKSLPPQAKQVFTMSRYDGKSHLEISQELKINIKTVESHITRALSSLRALLLRKGTGSKS